METLWNREAFEASITRACFSSTPYDVGWEGDPKGEIDGGVLQSDQQMRRLLEMETALRPMPQWAHAIARQVAGLPPCGWCFPRYVEAVCINIGCGDPEAAAPHGCYDVGPRRMALLANFAVCLDGWLKGIAADVVAVELRQHTTVNGRDWGRFARQVHTVLGEPKPARVLLVRRLLARLRFWLRAPLGTARPDENWRLGYFYTNAMGRFGGWDYFSFQDHDAEAAELDARIRTELDEPKCWLDLINSTWPCAPKVFRYIERLIIAVGRVGDVEGRIPPRITDSVPEGVLGIEDTWLSSDHSRALYDSALAALAGHVAGVFPADAADPKLVDAQLTTHLADLLGKSSPVTQWIAALLFKRITLFTDSFKSFHFTRDPNQIH